LLVIAKESIRRLPLAMNASDVEAAQPDGVARRAARFDQIHDDEDVVLVDGDLDLDWSDAGPPCAMAFAASS
jgi:hypothetical protein